MIDEVILSELFEVVMNEDAEERWLDKIRAYRESGRNLHIVEECSGRGLLHFAAENGFPAVIEYLIKSGIGVDTRDKLGSTPLLWALDSAIDGASQNEESEIDFSAVKKLIDNGADLAAESSDGISLKSLLENYGAGATKQFYEVFPTVKH